MVETGHAEIRSVEYSSARHPQLPVEVIERSELFDRFGSNLAARPERANFTTLTLVREGQVRHTVDFVTVDLVPGRMMRVLPEQVQAWDVADSVVASIVLSASSPTSPVVWGTTRLSVT